jgi:hypothetical protein
MILLRSVLLAVAVTAMATGAEIPAGARSVLGRISADSMRGHTSFLASDLLQGRATPSPGLDLAAEYIAAQFRRAGLEPGGDDGYFQTANFLSLTPSTEGLSFKAGDAMVDAANLSADATVGVAADDAEAIKWAEGQSVEGKVALVYAADFRAAVAARRQLAGQRPSLIVLTGPGGVRMRARNPLIAADARGRSPAVLYVRDAKVAAEVEKAAPGPLPFRITARVPEPAATAVKLRNVVAILRGSDPVLKDTCVLATAHYDHMGVRASGDGDRIFNGANDDASGVVTLIETAAALAQLNPRPRRSIVFVALFGEELGLLGSRYYSAHPVFPLAKTVADVNLEHMGRTDSGQGSNAGMVNFTGHDFSDVPAVFAKAGEATGVKVVKDEKNSDLYFARSDNQALADVGVPAHTISVTYEFPDYHRPGDEWEKLDYDNMALVGRMVALGLSMIADNPQAPRWNAAEPKARKYLEAAEKLGQ